MKSFFRVYWCLFLFLSVAVVSCKGPSISQLSSAEGIERIRSNYTKKNWLEVTTDVDEYKTRYPYSAYLQEADLMQGDAYFQIEHFPEAVGVYEDFIRKNPTHAQVSFVRYRLAQCYDFQAPLAADRDQANAKKALAYYVEALQRDPGASWSHDAKERQAILEKRLFQNSLFIADFYWAQGQYAAALSRYLQLLDHSKSQDDPATRNKIKARAQQCYRKLADELEKDPTSDRYVHFQGETPASLRAKAEALP